MICKICGSEIDPNNLLEGQYCPSCGCIITPEQLASEQPTEQYQQTAEQYQQTTEQYQQTVEQYQQPAEEFQQQPFEQFQQQAEQYQQYQQPTEQYQQPAEQFQQNEPAVEQPAAQFKQDTPPAAPLKQPESNVLEFKPKAPTADNTAAGKAPVSKPSGSSGSGGGSGKKKGLIIAIISAVVVIAGVVTVLLLTNKKDKKKDNKEQAQVSTEATTDENGNTSTEVSSGDTETPTTEDQSTEAPTTEVTQVETDPDIWNDHSVFNMTFPAPPEDYKYSSMRVIIDKDGIQHDKQVEYRTGSGNALSYYVIYGYKLADLGIDLAGLEKVDQAGHTFYIYQEHDDYYALTEDGDLIYVILYEPLIKGDDAPFRDALSQVAFTEGAENPKYSTTLYDLTYSIPDGLPFCGYAISISADKETNKVTEKSLTLIFGKDTTSYDYSIIMNAYFDSTIDFQAGDLSEYEIKAIGDNTFNAKLPDDDETYNSSTYFTQHGNDVYRIRDNGKQSSWLYERSDESAAAFDKFIETVGFSTGNGTAAEIPEKVKPVVSVPENPIFYEDDQIKLEITQTTYRPPEAKQASYEYTYEMNYKVTNKTDKVISRVDVYDVVINHFCFSSNNDLVYYGNVYQIDPGQSIEGTLEWNDGEGGYLTDGQVIQAMVYYKFEGESTYTQNKVTYYPHGDNVDKNDTPDMSDKTPAFDKDGLKIYITREDIGYTGSSTQVTFEGYIINESDKILVFRNPDGTVATLTAGENRTITNFSCYGDVHPGCVSTFHMTVSIDGDDVSADYADGMSLEIPYEIKYIDETTENGEYKDLSNGTFAYTSGPLE